ncbi:hypothetical protein YC2023_042292 [Brassica napus]
MWWNRTGFDLGDCGRCDDVTVRSFDDWTGGSTNSSTYLGVSDRLALCVSLSSFYFQVKSLFFFFSSMIIM